MLGPRARLPLLVLAALALVAGVWGGLVRMQAPFALPSLGAGWLTFHGPLMVAAFLGTLIALERAVAVGRTAALVVPLVNGVGGVALALDLVGGPGPWLLAVGAAGYAVLCTLLVLRRRAMFTVLPALASLGLVAANTAWALGAAIPHVVPGWVVFLVLTITGERLELTRLRRPVRGEVPVLLLAVAVLAVGAAAAPLAAWGVHVLGAGAILVAAWLLVRDVAWRTVRMPGAPRYVAVCLLAGYAWLAVGGVQLAAGTPLRSGLPYDGAIHAVFLGFTFSMIFGHAPVVLPALLGISLPVTRLGSYVPVALLHAAVAARVLADVLGAPAWRTRAGIAAAVAIALFIVTSAVTAVRATRRGRDTTEDASV